LQVLMIMKKIAVILICLILCCAAAFAWDISLGYDLVRNNGYYSTLGLTVSHDIKNVELGVGAITDVPLRMINFLINPSNGYKRSDIIKYFFGSESGARVTLYNDFGLKAYIIYNMINSDPFKVGFGVSGDIQAPSNVSKSGEYYPFSLNAMAKINVNLSKHSGLFVSAELPVVKNDPKGENAKHTDFFWQEGKFSDKHVTLGYTYSF